MIELINTYKCECMTIADYQFEYAYDCNTYVIDIDKLYKYTTSKSDGFITFDIETSRVKLREDTYETFMYHWQICIDDDVIFGRTWQELLYFLEKIKKHIEHKLIIYVHNLSYEFQFIKDFFEWYNVFSIDEHSVIKCLTKDKKFEFRCSYKLSNMSLEKFIENTPKHYFIKGKGDLDYKKLRVPSTVLSPKERGYCYNDVRCLYHSIEHLLEDDDLDTIPLTSTGYVRRECRKAMRTPEDRKIFNNSKINLKLYDLLKEGFRGGNTASNRYHTNTIIDNVHSYDMSSAYPYVMMVEKFPFGKFNKCSIEDIKELDYYNNKYCTIARYKFKNLRLYSNTVPIPYISSSKCSKIHKEALCYNGRVLESDYAEMVLTNVDFEIIEAQYDYDDLIIEDFYFARKKKLSRNFRKTIMKYYRDKTELKGVDEEFYFYMKQKGKLNSLYGMLVSNIVRDSYDFDIELNALVKKEVDEDDRKVELDKYLKSRNSFLVYAWGVWVTAYCRRNLQELIDIIGIDVVYCDTDSVKYIGNYDSYIEKINNRIKNQIVDMPIYAKDKKGNPIYLGCWDEEPSYDRFITLGAKKYAYEKKGKIGVTVSGLNKYNAPIELKEKGGLEYFRNGEVFYNSGRITVEYHHDSIHTINVNGELIETGSYINMFDTTYTLGITDTMLDIINSI